MEAYERSKEALLEALLTCDVYTNYLDKKQALDEEPEKKRQVNAFRRRNYEFHQSQYIENYDQELDRLSADLEEMRKDPVIDEFLSAELSVCRLLQKLAADVVSSVDMDIDFI